MLACLNQLVSPPRDLMSWNRCFGESYKHPSAIGILSSILNVLHNLDAIMSSFADLQSMWFVIHHSGFEISSPK